MPDKTVDLWLRVTTILVGGDIASKLSKGFGGLAKQAGLANLSLGKIAGVAAAVTLGFKGMESVVGFMQKGTQHARDYRDAQEKLNMTIEKFPGLAKKGDEFVGLQKESMRKLAEQQQEVGVFMAKDLTGAFNSLMKGGFSPQAINNISTAFQGTVVAMRGITASGQDVVDTANKIAQAVKRGKIDAELGKALGITKEQAQAFSKLKTEAQRGAKMTELLGRNTFKMAEAMGTTQGQLTKSSQVWEVLAQKMGAPFVQAQDAFQIAMGKLGVALTPVVEKIAAQLTPALEKFATWLGDQGPNIAKFGDVLSKAFDWILKNWEPISKGLTAVGIAVGGLMAFAFLSSPIGMVTVALTALGAAVTLVAANWKDIAPAAQAAWTQVTAVFGNVAGWLNTTLVQPIKNATEPLWKPIAEGASKLWGEISPHFTKISEGISKLFTGKISFTDFKTSVTESLQGIVDAFRNFDWAGLGSNITEGFAKIDWGAIGSAFGKALADMLKLAIAGYFKLGELLTQSATTTDWGGIGTAVLNGITNVFTNIVPNLVGGFFTTFVQEMTGKSWSDIAKPIMDEVASWPQKISTALVGVGQAIIDAFSKGFDAVVTMAKGIPGKVGGAIWNFIMGKGGGGGGAAPEGAQYGGMFSHPAVTTIAEKGPEMVIPMEGTARSRGLLSSAAEALGMGGMFRGGAAGGMNVSVTPNITINGVAAGTEGAVGREVERAMQSSIQRMLEDLARARDEERRLAYV